ncbi:fimbria/pilus periplasmic chaperone [Morganella morganii]|nr:fimbria/pilus periplasmic chaperone [Morganella morganii]
MKNLLLTFFISILSFSSVASSVLPDVSAIVINEEDGEGTIGIKNTNSYPVLLYAKVLRLEDDNLSGGALIPSPAAVTVEPGETQIIRIMYKNNTLIDNEHHARVQFIGLPPKSNKTSGRINLMVGQDIPVVIRPKGSLIVEDKWKYLKWTFDSNNLCVSNDTKMVMRFINTISIKPDNVIVDMKKSYLLPKSKLCAPLPLNNKINFNPDRMVEFSAVTDFGYIIDNRTSPILNR